MTKIIKISKKLSGYSIFLRSCIIFFLEKELYEAGTPRNEDELAMAELEAEIDKITGNEYESSVSQSRSTLPAGAVPFQNGVMSKHAAEFWFPECRNCECCNGFKHGCSCCTKGITQCQASGCGQTGASEAVKHQSTPAAPVPPAAPATTGKVIPAGAMPSQNGVLSRFAGEFWFPEARNCSCCQGFKHGCRCCAGGVSTCQAEGCTGDSTSPAASTPPPAPADTRPGHLSASANEYVPGGASMPAPPAAGGRKVCQFYRRGNCMFGANCKNLHA